MCLTKLVIQNGIVGLFVYIADKFYGHTWHISVQKLFLFMWYDYDNNGFWERILLVCFFPCTAPFTEDKDVLFNLEIGNLRKWYSK